jgi:hypothetical protein
MRQAGGKGRIGRMGLKPGKAPHGGPLAIIEAF